MMNPVFYGQYAHYSAQAVAEIVTRTKRSIKEATTWASRPQSQTHMTAEHVMLVEMLHDIEWASRGLLDLLKQYALVADALGVDGKRNPRLEKAFEDAYGYNIDKFMSMRKQLEDELDDKIE